ncbi:integrase arm-type DNA-binding domain-containing protein [uncultured Hyphomonas sp.]|uniref:tyrosine-type recombinase/integrase n=1 Tax=uncultured Hyphomonas sp. TaxID=225298 RepID=UPI0030DB65BC|tara:strand:+ start:603002 stop:604189 length:1188 start_codon:yes stop_codon:yes gene_type:complete
MPLTDLKIRSLKPEEKPRRYTDGGNLFVEVRPTGSKLWRFAYKFDGKQKLMALGAYPEISLAKAREKRAEARALLIDGIDPMQQAKIDKLERQALTEHTFSAIAEELLEKNRKEGLAETTLSKKAWLIGIANADLANMPVTQVKPAHVLVPLRKVEADGNYETARRLRAVISQVFRYAVATARCEHDPTAGLRGALIVPKVRHRPAIVDRDGFAGLVRAIWGYDGAIETQAGLQLMALLYPRPGELRLSKWNEFHLQKRVWTIPAERTKMRREHRKPLSEPAVKILKRLESVTGHEPWVFVSQLSRGKPISENTLNGALRRLGFGANEMTSHGFRASASSLLNESGKWHPDAIEAELAHRGADQVRKAYHRATYWDQRVEMAEWWASEVVSFASS